MFIPDGFSNIQRRAAPPSELDSVLIYTSFADVPVTRGGDVARRGQLRKPEQPV